MNLWNINKLKDDLSNKKVNQRDLLVYYLIGGVLAAFSIPGESTYSYFQEENYAWILWGVGNLIYFVTIFLSYRANKGSKGNNFVERLFSLEIILIIRYLIFFLIPYEIFHFLTIGEGPSSDLGHLLSGIFFFLIVSIKTVQGMKDIQKI